MAGQNLVCIIRRRDCSVDEHRLTTAEDVHSAIARAQGDLRTGLPSSSSYSLRLEHRLGRIIQFMHGERGSP